MEKSLVPWSVKTVAAKRVVAFSTVDETRPGSGLLDVALAVPLTDAGERLGAPQSGPRIRIRLADVS